MANQRWLRELSRKTGESRKTLRDRGFTLEQITGIDIDNEESSSAIRMIDWDAMEASRGIGLRPQGHV